MNDSELVAQSTDILAHHGRSFSLASVFLPEDRRGQAAVLYAFCRLADDAVDEAPDPARAREAVTELRAELTGSASPRPVVAATAEILQPVGLEPALDLLHGVESDLDFEVPEDDEALDRYCYEVAGTVGLMMCAALGVEEEWAFGRAVKLGMAMQLTNICRDVLEDAERARVYLPRTRLEAAGVSESDLLEGRADPTAVAGIVRDLLDRADDLYAVGRSGFPALPFRSRVAIAVAARLYQGIGHRLRRNGANPLMGRTVVPSWEKGLLVARAMGDLIKSRIVGQPPAIVESAQLDTSSTSA